MSLDITPYIKAKSDRLNADDLVGGDITVQIVGVRKVSGEQPIQIQISGGHMPWHPSKTALRVLSAKEAWGTDASTWVGRWIRLYRDATVKWAGAAVGGIRIRAMSHIAAPFSLSLAESQKSKKIERVLVLAPNEYATTGKATASLDALLSDAGLTPDDVDRWGASKGLAPLATWRDNERAALAVDLASKPALMDEIRNVTAKTKEE